MLSPASRGRGLKLLGEGWSFSFSDRLEDSQDSNDPAGTKIWYTGSGDRLKFEPNGSGGFITPDGIHGALYWVNGIFHMGLDSYCWKDTQGNKTWFDASTGRLDCIEDRYGNGLYVDHYQQIYVPDDPDYWRIEEVFDLEDSSRKLSFYYTGDLITSITDYTGRTWTYAYDANGRLDTVTAPSNASTPQAVAEYTYYTDDARDGLLQTVTDPNDGVTTFTYYANRRGFEVTDAEGRVESFSYNVFRDRTAYTDAAGNTNYYTHNDDGNVTEVLQPDRTTVETTWENGLRTSVTDEFGRTETYDYDADGNLIEYVDRVGYVTTYQYTDYANIESIASEGDPATSSDDRITFYRYYTDGSGKDSSLHEVEDALGNITHYTYPTPDRGLPDSMTLPEGVLTSGDPNDYVTTYEYNAAGQLTEKASRVSATETVTETFDYDAYGRGTMVTSTDGLGNETTYTYDLLNRKLTETLPDPDGDGPLPAPVTTYEYDAIGNVLSATDQGGRVTAYE